MIYTCIHVYIYTHIPVYMIDIIYIYRYVYRSSIYCVYLWMYICIYVHVDQGKYSNNTITNTTMYMYGNHSRTVVLITFMVGTIRKLVILMISSCGSNIIQHPRDRPRSEGS